MLNNIISPLKTKPAFFLARLLLVTPFVISGVHKITAFQPVVDFTASAGIPLPHIAVILTIILDLAGSAVIIHNKSPLAPLTALLFAGFCVLTAVIFHLHEPIALQKNLALAGAFLILLKAQRC